MLALIRRLGKGKRPPVRAPVRSQRPAAAGYLMLPPTTISPRSTFGLQPGSGPRSIAHVRMLLQQFRFRWADTPDGRVDGSY